MTRRLRIGHVVLDLESGGLERMVADLLRTLDTSAFESHLIALNFLGRYAEGLEAHARLHVAPTGGRLSMLWPRRLAQFLQSLQLDVLHTHSGVWFKASRAGRLASIPVLVHTEHGRARFPDPYLDRLVDRWAANHTDAVVAVSDAARETLAHSIAVDENKLVVIRNGIDLTHFAPRPVDPTLRQELGIPPQSPIISSIGRFDPIKGFDVVIDAFRNLCNDMAATGTLPTLLLVGDGPERGELEHRVQSHALTTQVRFVGWRADILRILTSSDVFTLGSRSEGTSISLLEALASACPAVVTNVGGNAQVMGPALQHRLVPSENPPALAVAWRRSIENVTQSNHDRIVGRQHVESKYSLQAMTARYEALYRAVTTGTTP